VRDGAPPGSCSTPFGTTLRAQLAAMLGRTLLACRDRRLCALRDGGGLAQRVGQAAGLELG